MLVPCKETDYFAEKLLEMKMMKLTMLMVLCLGMLSCESPESANRKTKVNEQKEIFTEDDVQFAGQWQIEYYLDKKYEHVMLVTNDHGILEAHIDGQQCELSIKGSEISFKNEKANFEGKIMGNTIWGKLKMFEGPFSNQRISWTGSRK